MIGQPLSGLDGLWGQVPQVPFGHLRLLKGNPFGVFEE